MEKKMHHIIDDFLDKSDFERIQSVMTGDGFPWYLQSYVSTKDSDAINPYPGSFLGHMFYNNYAPNSHLFGLLEPLIKAINPNAIIRIKANLYPTMKQYYEHNMHVDQHFSHNGAIYHLNTNNGHTILEDGTKLESVANRIIFFDTSKPHKSTNSTDQKFRMNININYF